MFQESKYRYHKLGTLITILWLDFCPTFLSATETQEDRYLDIWRSTHCTWYSIISVSAFVPKFVSRRNIAMGCKYKLCENSIKAGCFLCTSVIFQAIPGVKTGTLERPLASDGSFYTVPVCRRIDDFHFSCGTVSKSKFTSCLIKSTKF